MFTKYNGWMAMRTNESIIAVPVSVEQKGQTRQFLVRLVEKLDVILGRRGGDPYVATSQLAETQEGLTQLEQTVLDIIERLLGTADSETVLTLIAATADATDAAINEAIESLKSSSTISNSSTTAGTYSGPPTKGEVEALDAKVIGNAADFNSLLTALRGTGIIAT